MGKNPAFQFYPGDWRRDTQVQMASLATRGVWIEMLCCMWFAPERGKLEGTAEQLARLVGCLEQELTEAINELNVTKMADVTNGNGTLTIINRRMFREETARKATRKRVQEFRDKEKQRACNDDVTPPSPTPSSPTPVQDTLGGEKISPCPHKSIIGIYNDILGKQLPMVRLKSWANTTGEQHLQARWREDNARQSLEFWKGLFEYIRNDCPFLMGEVKPEFRAGGLRWIVKKDNFIKIIEGNYVKR